MHFQRQQNKCHSKATLKTYLSILLLPKNVNFETVFSSKPAQKLIQKFSHSDCFILLLLNTFEQVEKSSLSTTSVRIAMAQRAKIVFFREAGRRNETRSFYGRSYECSSTVFPRYMYII